MSLPKTDSISLNLKPLFLRKLFCFNFSLVSGLGPSLNFFEKANLAADSQSPSSIITLFVTDSSTPFDEESVDYLENLVFKCDDINNQEILNA